MISVVAVTTRPVNCTLSIIGRIDITTRQELNVINSMSCSLPRFIRRSNSRDLRNRCEPTSDQFNARDSVTNFTHDDTERITDNSIASRTQPVSISPWLF